MGELAQKKGAVMDRLAQLRESLSRLSLPELKLMLEFTEWLKEYSGGLAD